MRYVSCIAIVSAGLLLSSPSWAATTHQRAPNAKNVLIQEDLTKKTVKAPTKKSVKKSSKATAKSQKTVKAKAPAASVSAKSVAKASKKQSAKPVAKRQTKTVSKSKPNRKPAAVTAQQPKYWSVQCYRGFIKDNYVYCAKKGSAVTGKRTPAGKAAGKNVVKKTVVDFDKSKRK